MQAMFVFLILMFMMPKMCEFYKELNQKKKNVSFSNRLNFCCKKFEFNFVKYIIKINETD